MHPRSQNGDVELPGGARCGALCGVDQKKIEHQTEFDVIVIGGGAVGENVAARAVQGGLRAVIVEAELLGGECSYWACMPSKALLRPGSALAAARRVPGAREAVTGRLDVAEVLKERDAIASDWKDDGQLDWARSSGIAVIKGTARITGPRRVRVEDADGTREITAVQAVVVCTGSAPRTPPIPGLDEIRTWTSRDATSARSVPRRLAVLGGGPVGVELAQAWARLGSNVTLINGGPRLLQSFEDFAGELVAEGLREDGVEVLLDTTLERVGAEAGGIALRTDEGRRIKADELLVATGRSPATHAIGLDVVGLTPGEPLRVDDSGQVTGIEGSWLYAAGDVTGRAPLTHQGKYAARVVGDVIAGRAAGTPEARSASPWSRFAATADHTAVPQVVFTDPEVAAVGFTADAARQAGLRTRVVDLDIAVGGSSVHAKDYRGRARMVVDEDRRVLVGVTFAGYDVAELLHAATIAIVGEVPIDRLWHAVPAYPTISEVWLRLLEKYGL
ncbi:dihydrolipoamide dehydrogenase [Actinoalloteichus sp. GBA129-24]|uniref:Dihydrolipoamide dehydrogenase n=1 Tax=Actinoalloteichus fjordicus TaxID=1612552 RepID=A0AAC9LFX4_9PSEU|nr:dihydrolipoamide dehydrogenase [Actinoalloteichus fjordicus]APU23180.1 dihydrolipoamide dehydrogenase [Actinoalloteichus sp. GBA129-24]